MEKNFLPGLGFCVGEINERVLVCGDPKRAEKIAMMLDDMKLVAKSREYWTFNGKYKGVPITVSSHGVGASGAIMAFIGVMKAGAKVVIRMGTAGTISKTVNVGSQVIATAASKEDGVCDIYAPKSFPAVADIDVVIALKEAAKDYESSTGVIVTHGAFYGGYREHNTLEHVSLGAKALEMEVASLFIAGAMENVKTGAIVTIDGNALSVLDDATGYNPDPIMLKNAIENGIKIALDALIEVKL